jgi:hypothetical protein
MKDTIDNDFIKTVFDKINARPNNRYVRPISKHSCNSTTKNELVDQLKKRGFRVGFGKNSYNIQTIIVEW